MARFARVAWIVLPRVAKGGESGEVEWGIGGSEGSNGGEDRNDGGEGEGG